MFKLCFWVWALTTLFMWFWMLRISFLTASFVNDLLISLFLVETELSVCYTTRCCCVICCLSVFILFIDCTCLLDSPVNWISYDWLVAFDLWSILLSKLLILLSLFLLLNSSSESLMSSNDGICCPIFMGCLYSWGSSRLVLELFAYKP